MTPDRKLVVEDDPKSVGSEAFRTLRTNLQFTSPDRELRTVLMTSAGPEEGKSTVSANLAVAAAQSGQNVVLVGCDLRKPVVHSVFDLANAPGLTAYLTGQAEKEQVLLPTRVKGLRVIPSGPIPPNPSELLHSRAMKDLLGDLAQQADLVLLDAAPIIAVTDAAVLATLVDGVVLVLTAHKVPRDVAAHAKTLLERVNARILGVVLNGVRLDKKRDHYYYYSEGS